MDSPVENLRLELIPDSRRGDFRNIFNYYLIELAPYTGHHALGGGYAYQFFDNYWQEPTERWPYWLVDNRGQVTAFAMVRRVEPGLFEVAEFSVTPDFRGKGLGTRLLNEIMKAHPGKWRLSYDSVNTPAKAFWEKTFGSMDGCQRKTTQQDGRIREELYVG